MNRKEAEDFVYRSYLKAKKYQDYSLKDKDRRRPDLTKDIIQKKSITPCVVITGSKGKGSVARMVSSVLETEYKTGLMTSPHVCDFLERFRINGTDVSEDDFVRYMNEIREEIELIDQNIDESECVSPMGVEADFALTYFNAEKTDFNIFECGKGAEYDDVNNIRHDYAIINSIFLEHTRELGDTLKEIAKDKAHVINGEQKCVYVGKQSDEVYEVIKERASLFNVPLKIYGRDFYAENIRYTNEGMVFDVTADNEKYCEISIPLLGEHQVRNCALALALCKDVLKKADPDKFRASLRNISWPGRMELVSKEPVTILDACINAESADNVLDVLKHMNIHKAVTVIGIPDDKDYLGVIRKMNDVSKKIILTKSDNPHYIFSDMQCIKAGEYGIETLWADSLKEAVEEAKKENSPIVVLGTTSLISEFKRKSL